jgi:hypothetical protein
MTCKKSWIFNSLQRRQTGKTVGTGDMEKLQNQQQNSKTE